MDGMNDDEAGEESDETSNLDEEDSDQDHVVSDQEGNQMKAYGECHGISNGVSLSAFSLLTCHRSYGSY